LECDGERWHYDKVEEDLARQALLERLGWTFVRIRGSTFYRDRSPHREQAMKPVFDKLQEFGIEPFTQKESEPSEMVHDLLEAIKRRASEIKVRGQDDVVRQAQMPLPVAGVGSRPLSSKSAVYAEVPISSRVNEQPNLSNAFRESNPLSQTPLSAAHQPKSAHVHGVNDSEEVPKASVLPPLRKGVRIEHVSFGLGTVLAVRSFGDAAYELEVKFDESKVVKVIKPLASNLKVL
jgi:hypothetical protein